MSHPSLDNLGQLILSRRGRVGVRATASAIGISPATLSRVENGHLPDLENFRKICVWLEIDPSTVLGIDASKYEATVVSVHFRKDRTMMPETSLALSEMILAAQRSLIAKTDQKQE